MALLRGQHNKTKQNKTDVGVNVEKKDPIHFYGNKN